MIFRAPPKNFAHKVEVVSCFCECQGKILLLHRQDHKQYGNTWGPPAGKINKSESAGQAVIRELWEESGIKADDNCVKYFNKYYVRYPEYDFVFHVFHLYCESLPKVRIRKEEHKSHLWLSPVEALKMELIRDQDEVIRIFFKI